MNYCVCHSTIKIHHIYPIHEVSKVLLKANSKQLSCLVKNWVNNTNGQEQGERVGLSFTQVFLGKFESIVDVDMHCIPTNVTHLSQLHEKVEGVMVEAEYIPFVFNELLQGQGVKHF